jgi:fatty-acyl-CoA synthase
VVLRPEWRDRIDGQAIIDWCRQNMAVYKAPRIVAFVDALPKSGSGKIQWRELQDREAAAVEAAAVTGRGGPA